MSGGNSDLKGLHDQLRKEWDRYKMKENEPGVLDECGRLLNQLKVRLTQAQSSFLPTQDLKTPPLDMIHARNILEIGALWSIHKKDVESFERYMAQLKCYYLDYSPAGVPESVYKNQLLGLNLLRLLSQNRLADFHTELELLPVEVRTTDQYIKHPVSTEQYLMEGSYNKVFAASGSIPAKEYGFFMSHLLQTIRDEISSCIEKAYEKISFNEALRMLNFQSGQEQLLINYVAETTLPNLLQTTLPTSFKKRGWALNTADRMYYFEKEKKADDVIPSLDLAQQAIGYARELEMIV